MFYMRVLRQPKVSRNKKDERGIVIINKARLVAQGYTQEEEIDYDEVFSPVGRIEAIRLFLAYASFKDFMVYQMDIKSAFLYGKIEEEVYVCQPLRFEDPNFLDRVYKVKKALYGLHQAPRAWIHETYKNVSQEIRDQLNAEAEAVQIILTGIDNDIYSIVDACPNACEMKAIERMVNHWNRITQVNEIRPEKIARVANPLAFVAQQQPVYHPQNHPTHYTQNSSSRSQQAATRNKGKAIINSPQPIYDQEPSMVAEDDETSKDKEIDKLMALISLSFKKIYKPTNDNL
nr:retrovirus-related Pol polyprotein from transposon TNT 1-94 [Tanacetum cinerariifolium]